MAAAKPERVQAAEREHDFWAIIDEELARLSLPLREVLLLCDLGGQSHSQAAASLGLAKGTITKRLAKAREELATRLQRRGITLGVGAVSTMIATQARASVPALLVLETAKQAVAFSIRQLVGSETARTLAEGVMRSLKFGVLKVWLVVGLLGLMLTGGGLMLAGGPEGPGEKQVEPPPARVDKRPEAAKVGTMWKESYTVADEGKLPVSVAFSADGKTLLTGDANGEVTALEFAGDDLQWPWKANVGGSHAAVAYSADQKNVYVTTANGVRILDAARGKDVAQIDAPDSNPIAIGVFPNKTIAGKSSRLQIVFGNARGYFVKSWADVGKPADTISTIEISTVVKDAKPADMAAVPLAVDPKGRTRDHDGAARREDQQERAVGLRLRRPFRGQSRKPRHGRPHRDRRCSGLGEGRQHRRDRRRRRPRDRVGRDNDEGNTPHRAGRPRHGRRHLGRWRRYRRLRPREARRRGLRVADREAGQGAEADPHRVGRLWRRALCQPGVLARRPATRGMCQRQEMAPARSQDAPTGKIRVWELAPEPKAQPVPKHVYTKKLPKGNSSSFVIVYNHLLLTAATKEGAIDFRDLSEGDILSRIVFGKFTIGAMKLSSDRKWLVMEQHPVT